MQIHEMNPYIRFFQRRFSALAYPTLVYAYDFRLFYVKQGSIEVQTEEGSHLLKCGSILLLPPAYGYRLEFHCSRVEYAVINFDFSMTARGSAATPPVPRELFLSQRVFSMDCPTLFSKPFFAESGTRLQSLFDALERTSKKGSPALDAASSGLMKYLLGELASDVAGEREDVLADGFVRKVKAYVEANLAGKITLGSVARALGYHPNYLSARFLELSGQSLHRYIEAQRMSLAKGLLVSTDLSVAQVGERCGFSEPSYFVKAFVRFEGTTPGKYRRLAM